MPLAPLPVPPSAYIEDLTTWLVSRAEAQGVSLTDLARQYLRLAVEAAYTEPPPLDTKVVSPLPEGVPKPPEYWLSPLPSDGKAAWTKRTGELAELWERTLKGEHVTGAGANKRKVTLPDLVSDMVSAARVLFEKGL
jgi:hypothetical protein